MLTPALIAAALIFDTWTIPLVLWSNLKNGLVNRWPSLDFASTKCAANAQLLVEDIEQAPAITSEGFPVKTNRTAAIVLCPAVRSCPAFNWMSEMPFPAIQALFDPFFPKGLQWYWKGDFVKSLPDEAIDMHIAQAAKAPSELSLMHLYPIDGAVHRVPKDATAWNTRSA